MYKIISFGLLVLFASCDTTTLPFNNKVLLSEEVEESSSTFVDTAAVRKKVMSNFRFDRSLMYDSLGYYNCDKGMAVEEVVRLNLDGDEFLDYMVIVAVGCGYCYEANWFLGNSGEEIGAVKGARLNLPFSIVDIPANDNQDEVLFDIMMSLYGDVLDLYRYNPDSNKVLPIYGNVYSGDYATVAKCNILNGKNNSADTIFVTHIPNKFDDQYDSSNAKIINGQQYYLFDQKQQKFIKAVE